MSRTVPGQPTYKCPGQYQDSRHLNAQNRIPREPSEKNPGEIQLSTVKNGLLLGAIQTILSDLTGFPEVASGLPLQFRNNKSCIKTVALKNSLIKKKPSHLYKYSVYIIISSYKKCHDKIISRILLAI